MSDFYLDTNVFVCLATDDERKAELMASLDILNTVEGTRFVTSDFTFVEMAKVLTHTKRQNTKAVAKLMNKITKLGQIENIKFEIIPTSPLDTYTFKDFWIDVSENMNLYNPGWGDSIHCVIMKNNKIPYIISFDEKDDFDIVQGITLLHPLNIELT